MLDVRKLLLCKYVYYYVNVWTCKDVKGFYINGGAAHPKTEAFQAIFNACAADGPDGSCVWSGAATATMKMALFPGVLKVPLCRTC